MSSPTTPFADMEAPRVSTVSGALALTVLPVALLAMGWSFYDWSHSVVLGCAMVFAAACVCVGFWMTLQTRITPTGVSGLNVRGLRLPRRVQLAWPDIRRIDISEHAVRVWGDRSTIDIPLGLFPDREDVTSFIARHMDQVTADRARDDN